jgi:hypothetical protein
VTPAALAASWRVTSRSAPATESSLPIGSNARLPTANPAPESLEWARAERSRCSYDHWWTPQRPRPSGAPRDRLRRQVRRLRRRNLGLEQLRPCLGHRVIGREHLARVHEVLLALDLGHAITDWCGDRAALGRNDCAVAPRAFARPGRARVPSLDRHVATGRTGSREPPGLHRR